MGEEAAFLGNLGLAYGSLGQYQQAIEIYQQSLEIAQQVGDRQGEANAWFNLGLALKETKKIKKAQVGFKAARSLYQEMGLGQDVQDCDEAIARLEQPEEGAITESGRPPNS